MTDETLEFLQSESSKDKDIRGKLQESINKCITLRGAVAFWTVDIGYFDGLVEKLSHADSFMCVDIHEPTRIDFLKKFVESGAKNIYLFLYHVESGRYPLMHTKLLVFDLPDNKAEIWIGSQNFTNSALSGFNFEATTVVSTTTTSSLYKKVIDYLNFIRKCCEDIKLIVDSIQSRFDPKLDDFYKKLQNTYDWQENRHQVLDFVCQDVNDIREISKQSDLCVLIASFDKDDCKKFVPGQKIIVRALDKNGEIICYESIVLSSGEIAAESQEDRSFVKTYVGSQQHYKVGSYIIQYGGTIPIFFSESPKMTDQSSSVIIKISDEFDGDLLSSERQDFWRNCSKNDFQSILYLKAILEQQDKKMIQVPKSPNIDKRNRSYPFDKIYERTDLISFFIEELYELALKGNYDQAKKSKDFRDTVILGGKQAIIRELVTQKNGNTDRKQPPRKKKISDNSGDLFS
jgi:HKD family nuclease